MQVFYRKTNVKPTQNYAYVIEQNINKLNDENIDFIELVALKSAVGFYEKAGFQQISREIPNSFKTVRSPPHNTYLKYLIDKNRKQRDKDYKEMLEISKKRTS
jgi:hypothetical protein